MVAAFAENSHSLPLPKVHQGQSHIQTSFRIVLLPLLYCCLLGSQVSSTYLYSSRLAFFRVHAWAPLKAIPVHSKVWKLLSWFIPYPLSSFHSPPGLDFTEHRCNVLNSFHPFACSCHLPSQSFTPGESFFQCCVLLSVVGIQLEKNYMTRQVGINMNSSFHEAQNPCLSLISLFPFPQQQLF